MSESPYRAAPPTEWPRSLRAAYRLGAAACRCPGDMSIRTFALVVTFCMGAGAAVGAGLMRDASTRHTLQSTCVVRAEGYNFALMTDDDVFPDTIGKFSGLSSAIDAAEKVGCKVVP